MTMSEGEEAISLSDAESEGEGPNIRPPQPSASLNKHKQKKRKRSRESSKYKRRSDERQKEKGGRDYDRHRDRDRSRNDVDSRRDRDENKDLRVQIIRGKYDRDRDRNSRGERRPYDRSSSEKRKDKNPDQEERKNRILMADKMAEEKRKEAEARKKTKLLEQEMERLQAVLKRKKAGQRSRSRSKGHKKKKKRKKSRSASSASQSNEEMETDNKKSGSEEESEEEDDQASTEVEEEQSESEEESESGEGSDSTASQKSEDTPEHEDNTSEDGEVEDDEEDKKLEELAEKVAIKSSKNNDEVKPMEEDKTPEKSPRIGGKWADKSPNRTPSRSPTPLKEDSDRTPGHGSGKGSRLNSPSTGALQPLDSMDSPPASPIPLKDELPPYLPSVHGCRNVAEFKCLNRIEEGTYGVVYRARDKRTNEIVALKKLKMEREKEGFPITSLREVNTLLIAQHPNVVHVREIVVGSIMDHIFIVMEFVQHDLKALMETLRKKNQVFLPGEVKCMMVQLLRAIGHLHDNWILHRDLKASNLLLSHKGILKVGDFGLAREYGSPLKHYTSVVVTLWYRSPELLLGTKEYSTHIDVWSIGCIFGELLLMEPLFPGKSEVDELNRIFKLLGTPSEKVWPGYKELPGVQKMKFVDYPISHLREKFPAKMLSEEGIQLLKDLLCYDPKRRITCDEALKAEYFLEDPRPVDPSMFPTWPAKSEQEPGDKVKKASSPKPPSGGHAFKKNLDDDDEARAKGFNLKGGPAPPSFTLKF